MRLWVAAFIVLACSARQLGASPIGTLRTADGQFYYISQFGAPGNAKNYHINVARQFVPLTHVQQIARIGTGFGDIRFQALLVSGELVDGRLGTLFFDRIEYRQSRDTEPKAGFVAVIKGRDNDGLIFLAYDPTTEREKIVEIQNPNDVLELILWDETTAELARGKLIPKMDAPKRDGSNSTFVSGGSL